jgi:hypothetical protein
MSTSFVSQELEFELPGEDWVDHSFHALVVPDGKLSCFVSRDPGDDAAAVLAERAHHITAEASDVRIEGVREGRLGSRESREVAVVAYEDRMWVYYRLSAALCDEGVLTIGVYGPDDSRESIDRAMDDIAAGILFRRRP